MIAKNILTLLFIIFVFGNQNLFAADISKINQALDVNDTETAYNLAYKNAKSGDVQSKLITAILCSQFNELKCDINEVLEWIDENKNVSSEVQYAKGLLFFKLNPPKTSQALKAISKASENGHADAQYMLGLLYESGKYLEQNTTKAFELSLKAAKSGHVLAQTRVATHYENGIKNFLKPNGLDAEKWYRLAAEKGFNEAQYHLGMMYMLGEKINSDPYEGIYWLEEAAFNGHLMAQDQLGRAYYSGFGVQKDTDKALEWFNKAGKGGLPKAMLNAGKIYEKNLHYYNPALARKLYKQAVDLGEDEAYIYLGDAYRYGVGGNEDIQTAMSMYEKALNSNNPDIAHRANNRLKSAKNSVATSNVAKFGSDEKSLHPALLFAGIVVISSILLGDGSGGNDNFRDEMAARDARNWNKQRLKDKFNNQFMDMVTIQDRF